MFYMLFLFFLMSSVILRLIPEFYWGHASLLTENYMKERGSFKATVVADLLAAHVGV